MNVEAVDAFFVAFPHVATNASLSWLVGVRLGVVVVLRANRTSVDGIAAALIPCKIAMTIGASTGHESWSIAVQRKSLRSLSLARPIDVEEEEVVSSSSPFRRLRVNSQNIDVKW